MIFQKLEQSQLQGTLFLALNDIQFVWIFSSVALSRSKAEISCRETNVLVIRTTNSINDDLAGYSRVKNNG